MANRKWHIAYGYIILRNIVLLPRFSRLNTKTHSKRYDQGFTLMELIVSVSILTLLFSLVTINLSSAQRKTSVNATVNIFIADLKEQQSKAMMGDTEGRVNSDSYGIHVQTNSYVLFHGSSYNPSDTSNREVAIEDTIQIDSSLSDIIFTRVSGEIAGYNAANDTIEFTDLTTGDSQTIEFNQLGVITAQN